VPLTVIEMTTHYRRHHGRFIESGFTLLEVLIALLVMSIGLLGIGKMMMLSARANDSAYMRSQATALAYTILDDMRANRATAISQGYDTAQVAPAQLACATAAPGCTAGQVAQNDTFLWNQALATALPNGAGTVVTAVAPDSTTGANNVTATITVTWSDKVAEQSFGNPLGNNISITLETVL
jgi:type IV pilus assembly protein PilV